MSDLSAPLASSASSAHGVPPGLRASGANTPPGHSGETPSFSSVLKDKSNAAKAAPKPAENAERPRERDETAAARTVERPDAAPAKATKAEKPDEQEVAAASNVAVTEDAGSDDNITPIAAVMIQLTPAALVSTAAQGEGLDAAQAIQGAQGALVREWARGHGRSEKNEEGNRGMALAMGHAETESTTGAVTVTPDQSAGQSSGQGSLTPGDETALGASSQAQPTVDPDVSEDSLATGVLTAATTAETDNKPSELGPRVESSVQETDFTQLLARARDGHAVSAAQENSLQGTRTETTLPMRAQVGHPNWNNELGDKMTWMVTNQKQQADLVLNPPQLGRIEVSLTVNGDQANAVFSSPNAAVRDMLENSLPRLREILAGSGLNLGQADVGAQSFAQQQQLAQENQRAAALAHSNAAEIALEAPMHAGGSLNLGRSGERPGVVDIFA